MDYDKFPIIYIEVNENALKKLLHNPFVKIVGENNKSLPLTEQSLTLIGSLTANVVGATGAGISVAVLDSGLEYTFAEFGTCSTPPVPNDPACRVDFVQDFAPDDNDVDDTGHGTYMSAIVHRVAPQTRILGLDVLSSDGIIYDSHSLAALNWVMANINTYNSIIRVVNMSWGWPPTKYTAPCPQDNLASAVASLKSAGVATVIASGNDGFKDGIRRPACIPDIISVGAVADRDDLGPQGPGVFWPDCHDESTGTNLVPCWSNSAPFLTMLAPGAIISALSMGSGTSQAAAHVSGAVAAIKTLLPGLSVDNVRALLTSTGAPATDTQANIVKPRLDLYAATPAIPTVCQNFARIVEGTDYASLEAAYDAAADGNTILATKSINTITNPERQGVLTIDKSLTFKGGYDYCNFTTQTGYAFIRGDVHISSGTVTMERIGITE